MREFKQQNKSVKKESFRVNMVKFENRQYYARFKCSSFLRFSLLAVRNADTMVPPRPAMPPRLNGLLPDTKAIAALPALL